MRDVLSFFRALLASPSEVGAVFPSSRHLAAAMGAAAAELDSGGQIIEIGAGSGALTQTLITHFGRERLQIIECAPALVDLLQQRFPHARIVAARAEDWLQAGARQTPGSLLVSSLPFKSLPAVTAHRLAHRYQQLVLQGARLLQFSYGVYPPFSLPPDRGLRWQQKRRIWLNLPPATIWELTSG